MSNLPPVDDDSHWSPPSEAEQKVLLARRERSNKISALMGGYLLKGYRMLADLCPECSNILMQDKQKRNYCVACNEVDGEFRKDIPSENGLTSTSSVNVNTSNEQALEHNGISPALPVASNLASGAKAQTASANLGFDRAVILKSVASVQSQMDKLANHLATEVEVESIRRIVECVKCCSDALLSLNALLVKLS